MQFDSQDIEQIQKTFLKSLDSGQTDKLIKHIDFIDKHFEIFTISDSKMGQGYEILATSKKKSDQKAIIYYVKAIKYLPEDISIRNKFIKHIISFLRENDEKFVKNDLSILKEEFSKLLRYVQLKWGRESKLAMNIYNLINEIERINYLSTDNEEGPLSDFIADVEILLKKYRPVEQALDYASQIVYDTIANRSQQI